MSTPDVAEILRSSGLTVAEGINAVERMIAVVADDDPSPRCSGYRVFPEGGGRCPGCSDCAHLP